MWFSLFVLTGLFIGVTNADGLDPSSRTSSSMPRLKTPGLFITETDRPFEAYLQNVTLNPFVIFPLLVTTDSLEHELELKLDVLIHRPELSFLHKPVILVHQRNIHGGSNQFEADTSNFCDWLVPPSLDPQEWIETSMKIPVVGEEARMQPVLKQGKYVSEFTMYVGLPKSHSYRTHDLLVKATLQNRSYEQFRACEEFEFPGSLSVLHMRASADPSKIHYVATRDLVIRDWSPGALEAIPGPSSILSPDRALMIGLDMPKFDPESDWPALEITGIEADKVVVLAGPMSATSIWELDRVTPVPAKDDRSSVVVHLHRSVEKIRRQKTYFAPPGISISVLIFSLEAEKDREVIVKPISDSAGAGLPQHLREDRTPRHALTRVYHGISSKGEKARRLVVDALAVIGVLAMVYGCWEVSNRLSENAPVFISALESSRDVELMSPSPLHTTPSTTKMSATNEEHEPERETSRLLE